MTTPLPAATDLSYEELHKLWDTHTPPGPSTNVDYQQCLAVVKQLEADQAFYTPARDIVRAGYEYLAGEHGTRVGTDEVLGLLAQPWRQALAQMLTYPPAAQTLLYVRILAAQASNPDEMGTRARVNFEAAIGLLQAVLAYPEKRAQEQERVAAHARLQRQAAHALAQRQQEQRMADRLNRVESLVGKLLLFGLGLATGWVAAHSFSF